MQPSSLIFLVLIAVWASYLLQHWVRRREHLATARSVDRFSEAMRVLERRPALPEPELSGPRAPSYAVSPTRPFRPEVVVKRAPSRREVPTAPAAAAVRPTRIFHLLASVSARRLRGLSLFVSLLSVLVVAPLVAFSVLSWWSVLLAFMVLVADLAFLRHVALSRRAKDWAEAQAVEADLDTAELADRHDYFDPEIDTQSDSESEIESPFEPEIPIEATSERMSPAASAELLEPIVLDVEVDPSAWAPVPVPPPTYTLKAKAAAPVRVPVVVPEPLAGEPWSLDGMVYDCELDELVERRSANSA